MLHSPQMVYLIADKQAGVMFFNTHIMDIEVNLWATFVSEEEALEVLFRMEEDGVVERGIWMVTPVPDLIFAHT